jgi:hypothetical protein
MDKGNKKIYNYIVDSLKNKTSEEIITILNELIEADDESIQTIVDCEPVSMNSDEVKFYIDNYKKDRDHLYGKALTYYQNGSVGEFDIVKFANDVLELRIPFQKEMIENKLYHNDEQTEILKHNFKYLLQSCSGFFYWILGFIIIVLLNRLSK